MAEKQIFELREMVLNSAEEWKVRGVNGTRAVIDALLPATTEAKKQNFRLIGNGGTEYVREQTQTIVMAGTELIEGGSKGKIVYHTEKGGAPVNKFDGKTESMVFRDKDKGVVGIALSDSKGEAIRVFVTRIRPDTEEWFDSQ